MSFHFNITCVVLFVLCLIPKNPTLFLYKLMIETYLIMLEIGKRAEMIAYDYRHYLALAHRGFPVSVALSVVGFQPFHEIFFCLGIKNLAKLVNNTEYFRNFAFGNHRL